MNALDTMRWLRDKQACYAARWWMLKPSLGELFFENDHSGRWSKGRTAEEGWLECPQPSWLIWLTDTCGVSDKLVPLLYPLAERCIHTYLCSTYNRVCDERVRHELEGLPKIVDQPTSMATLQVLNRTCKTHHAWMHLAREVLLSARMGKVTEMPFVYTVQIAYTVSSANSRDEVQLQLDAIRRIFPHAADVNPAFA